MKLASYLLATILVCALFLALSVDKPAPDMTLDVRVPISMNSRIKIARVGVIEDDLAYGHRRGLYVIQDTVTGKSFIGVSGIGITEVGSHMVGRAAEGDEQ